MLIWMVGLTFLILLILGEWDMSERFSVLIRTAPFSQSFLSQL